MSRLIYGCMGLGADVDRAEAAVLAAAELGVEWLDLADIYQGGRSEEVVGEVLRRHPGLGLKVQTKCGIDTGFYDLSRASIVARTEASLRRLGADRVDVLLLHRPDPLLEPAEVAAAFDQLHAAGKVGGFGVSNFSAAQLAYVQAACDRPLLVNQLELSLARADFVEAGVLVDHPEGAAVSFPEGTIEHCVTHGVRIQAWGSLAQGVYSGAPTRSDAEAATAELVASAARDHGATAEAVVLGWLLRHPAKIEPVIGTSSPDRIRACADAERVAAELTVQEWYGLFTAARGRNVP